MTPNASFEGPLEPAVLAPSKVAWSSRLYDFWFQKTHRHRLIYNTCWEDPRADRALLRINSDSDVLMLTSAGCNALDYLLDDPRSITSVDMNPKQNALLELKIAAICSLSHEDFFQLFGTGRHAQFASLYQQFLRPKLSRPAREIWDRNLGAFSPKGRGSFYFRGASGDVAYAVYSYLRFLKPGLRRDLLRLLEAINPREQATIWQNLEPKLFTRLLTTVVSQPLVLALLGVPREQRDLIERQYPGGLPAFIREKLRQVFATLPIQENYFWRVYMTGQYSQTCCPNYLKAENFALLQERVARIATISSTLTEFLRQNPDLTFSHFVLLDHQDWMAKNVPHDLVQEWHAIHRHARPQAKVILRSAALQPDFLPQELLVNAKVDGQGSEFWHARDRVGTYGSTWCATLGALPSCAIPSAV